MNDGLLLDTHALIWALSNPRKLPAKLARRLRDPGTDVYLSAVTTWEIAIKSALGKLSVDVRAVRREALDLHFEELPVTVAHTLRLETMANHHRDPFDRLLVAQCLEERLSLVTHNAALAAYGVAIAWA